MWQRQYEVAFACAERVCHTCRECRQKHILHGVRLFAASA
jgi:hypothetical protein